MSAQGAWKGASAAGYGSAANPQFLLRVRKTGKFAVTLKRTDGGAKTGMRFWVVENGTLAHRTGRVVDAARIRSSNVMESGYIVTDSLTCEGELKASERPYVVVACLKDTGVEGTFTLSVSGGDAAVALSSLPALVATTAKGEWRDATAAGYGKVANPQFQLRVKSAGPVIFSLKRTDSGEKEGMRLWVLDNGGAGRVMDEGLLQSGLVTESKFISGMELSHAFDAQPRNEPFVVLVSLQKPKSTGAFTLTVLAEDGAIEIEPIMPLTCSSAKGRFAVGISGFRNLNGPQVLMRVPAAMRVVLQLMSPEKEGVHMVLLKTQKFVRQNQLSPDEIVAETRFVKTDQLTLTAAVEAGTYAVLLSRGGTHIEVPYVFDVFSEKPVTLEPTEEEMDSNEVVVTCEDIISKYRSEEHPMLLTENPVDEINRVCEERRALFRDADFPPMDRSLNSAPQGGGKRVVPPVDWKRIDTFIDDPALFADGIDPSDMNQGSLGNCWFCQGVSGLAMNPDRVTSLFYPQTFSRYGVYAVRYFEHGRWYWVVIDDYFPTRDGKLCFASSKDENELWPTLLEKVFAKVYGSYQDLIGNNPARALASLSGGNAENVELKNLNQTQLDALWKRMVLYDEKGWLMSATSENKEGGNDNTTEGIVGYHAYSLIDTKESGAIRLLQLRNTWGRFEWQGAWSDTSDEWKKHPEMAELCKFAAADDGTFWISLEDFVRTFSVVTLCELLGDELQHHTTLDSEWTSEHVGGFRSPDNPQFEVVIEHPSRLMVQAVRLTRVEMQKSGFGAIVVRPGQASRRVFEITEADIVAATPYVSGHNATVTTDELPAGRYIVVPFCQQQGFVGKVRVVLHASAKPTMRVIPAARTTAVRGRFGEASSGAFQSPSNPQLVLSHSGAHPLAVRVRIEAEPIAETTGLCMFFVKNNGERILMLPSDDVVQSRHVRTNDLRFTLPTLAPGEPVTVLLCQSVEGIQRGFTFSATADEAVTVSPIADLVRTKVAGEWTLEKSGGNGSARAHNPQFHLVVRSTQNVVATLAREKDAEADGLQLWIFPGSAPLPVITTDLEVSLSSGFVIDEEVTASGVLAPGDYVVLAARQKKGSEGLGKFTITIDGETAVTLKAF